LLHCSNRILRRDDAFSAAKGEWVMPKGAYTAKQERKADHIAEGYRKEGVSKKEAEERAWRTVNAQDKGGKNDGSGRSRSRSAAAKKGWETRRRKGNG
jgi:plasmid stabilization system protein ParE